MNARRRKRMIRRLERLAAAQRRAIRRNERTMLRLGTRLAAIRDELGVRGSDG